MTRVWDRVGDAAMLHAARQGCSGCRRDWQTAVTGHVSAMVTVWFDGSCPLCTREIALMRRLDRRGTIAFVDIAGDAACPLDRPTLLARFHAQTEDAPMVSGAAAFAVMWRAIPILRPLGLLARIPLVLWGLERMYRLFLRVRPALVARL
jgi:predicted DCC family thiol-disulfide oxidoreductase YuxK